jgi:hypothetical protein
VALEAFDGGAVAEDHVDVEGGKAPEADAKDAAGKDEEDPTDIDELELWVGVKDAVEGGEDSAGTPGAVDGAPEDEEEEGLLVGKSDAVIDPVYIIKEGRGERWGGKR